MHDYVRSRNYKPTNLQHYYVEGQPFTMAQLAERLGVNTNVAKGRVRAAPRPLQWSDLTRPRDKAGKPDQG